jgi:hypothetical protein
MKEKHVMDIVNQLRKLIAKKYKKKKSKLRFVDKKYNHHKIKLKNWIFMKNLDRKKLMNIEMMNKK